MSLFTIFYISLLLRVVSGPYLTEQRQLVVRQQPVGLVQQEVPPDELLEAPVLPLDEAVRALAL